MERFNETEILKLLINDIRLQDCRTVQDQVWKQSSVRMSRRAVFRLLRKWKLNSVINRPTRMITVEVTSWLQPQDTMQDGAVALNGILWQINSGRGTECFMLSSDKCDKNMERVADIVAGRLKGRKRPLRTNHPRLADMLRDRLPRWEIGIYELV